MQEPLLLFPTEFELQTVRRLLAAHRSAQSFNFNVCGFGPIASGIGTARLLSDRRTKKVFLCGIAGAMSKSVAIGSAMSFSRVACYGVGAGSGTAFQTVEELGWQSWNKVGESREFGDVISLQSPLAESGTSGLTDGLLLTACSASSGSGDVEDRLQKFPQSLAEDMESYSVAMACKVADVPLTVIRGISNMAGDRDKSNWRIEAALQSVAELLLKVLR